MQIPEHELPLFPLNTVLFPRMPLPLHIFEPRYREMIARCLEERIGFGVLLIREGEEVGGPAIPHRVGTAARIIKAQPLEDGRMNLITMGVVRFRLLQTFDTHSYLSGDIELWEDELGDSAALARLSHAAHKLYLEYLNELIELSDASSSSDRIDAPQDPQVLSFAIAANLQIDNEDKQALLEIETVEERLRREVELLEQEREFLRRVKNMREMLAGNDEGVFSKN